MRKMESIKTKQAHGTNTVSLLFVNINLSF